MRPSARTSVAQMFIRSTWRPPRDPRGGSRVRARLAGARTSVACAVLADPLPRLPRFGQPSRRKQCLRSSFFRMRSHAIREPCRLRGGASRATRPSRVRRELPLLTPSLTHPPDFLASNRAASCPGSDREIEVRPLPGVGTEQCRRRASAQHPWGRSSVLEIMGTNVSTRKISCPADAKQTLGIKLPFLVMIIKNLKKYFSFEVQVLDDKNVRRRFRASNYQSTTRVKPFICTMPMRLDEGWNQIQFNLSDFTRRAYGTNYIETLRVQIHANCRIRRIYFSDRLYSEEELPPEFKLFRPSSSASTPRHRCPMIIRAHDVVRKWSRGVGSSPRRSSIFCSSLRARVEAAKATRRDGQRERNLRHEGPEVVAIFSLAEEHAAAIFFSATGGVKATSNVCDERSRGARLVHERAHLRHQERRRGPVGGSASRSSRRSGPARQRVSSHPRSVNEQGRRERVRRRTARKCTSPPPPRRSRSSAPSRPLVAVRARCPRAAVEPAPGILRSCPPLACSAHGGTRSGNTASARASARSRAASRARHPPGSRTRAVRARIVDPDVHPAHLLRRERGQRVDGLRRARRRDADAGTRSTTTTSSSAPRARGSRRGTSRPPRRRSPGSRVPAPSRGLWSSP